MAFLSISILLLTWPVIAWWRAYVFVTLWSWFASPEFGVPAPTIYAATGLMLMLVVASPSHRSSTDEGASLSSATKIVVRATIWPAMALGFAWVWKCLQWGIA